MKFSRTCRLQFLCVTAVAMVCGVAAAQEVRIDGAVDAPFPFSFQGQWNLRYPKITNAGDRDRKVLVVYQANPGQLGSVRHSRTVQVPAHSTVRTEISLQGPAVTPKPVPPAKGAKPAPQTQPALLSIEEVVDLYDANSLQPLGRSQARDAVSIKPRGQYIVGELGGGYGHSTSCLKDLLGPSHEAIKLTGRKDIAFTADKWYGMEGVRCLIVGRVAPSQLRPSQWQALLDWVRNGGILVLTGGTELGELLDGELGQAAGVYSSGLHMASSLQSPELGGAAIDLGTQMPMVELVPTGAEVLYHCDGLPLLTCNRLGFGAVYTLALPSVVLDAGDKKPLHALWERIVSVAKERPAVQNNESFLAADRMSASAKLKQSRRTAPDVLRQISGIQAPPRRVPVGILVGLAAAFAVVGGLLRFRRRGEWTWLAMVPVCALVAAGIYAASKIQTQPARLSYVALMTGLDDGHAAVQEVFSYYSGPSGGNETFYSGDGAGVITRLTEKGGSIDLSHVAAGTQMSLPDQRLAGNSNLPFYVKAMVKTQGLSGRVGLGPRGLEGTIANHMQWDLHDAVLYFNRKTYKLGEIPAGQSLKVQVDDSAALAVGEFSSVGVKDSSDNYRNELLAQVLGRGDQVRAEPTVVGYIKASPLSPMSKAPSTQGWTIVTWPVELATAPAGGKVVVPSAFVKLEMPAAGFDTYDETFRPAKLQTEKSVTVRVMARPIGLPGPLKDSKATLKFAIRAEGHTVTVCGVKGYNGRGGSEEILRTFKGSGRYEVTIDDADRFYSPRYGHVLAIRVSIEKPGIDAPDWKFESIDVSLEGTPQ